MIAAAITLGFLRDFVFVSINKMIESGNEDTGTLLIFKWGLTIVFSILYLVNTSLILFLIFRSRKYVVITLLVYSLLFVVSIVAGAAGFIFTSFENVYPYIRTVLGIAQSPVVMIILIPTCLIFNTPKIPK